eukprot:3649383-Pyramimonas_sp.AAC.1
MDGPEGAAAVWGEYAARADLQALRGYLRPMGIREVIANPIPKSLNAEVLKPKTLKRTGIARANPAPGVPGLRPP